MQRGNGVRDQVHGCHLCNPTIRAHGKVPRFPQLFRLEIALRRENPSFQTVPNKTNMSEGIHQHVEYLADLVK